MDKETRTTRPNLFSQIRIGNPKKHTSCFWVLAPVSNVFVWSRYVQINISRDDLFSHIKESLPCSLEPVHRVHLTLRGRFTFLVKKTQ